jgi:cytochrome c oxidase cbb3-type subunit I/II
MWAAGITQGLMWRAFDHTGRLQYPDFLETVTRLVPMYYVRVLGGALYITATAIGAYNIYKTWRSRPKQYAEIEVEVPVRAAKRPAAVLSREAEPPTSLHRRWEALPIVFSVLVAVAVIVASLFEILPTFLIGDNVPRISSVTPYRPLELYGRDIYIREGCYNCHSQMVRPFVDEVIRYKGGNPTGEYSKPGEFVYDHPFQWGSRRIGPDLAREGGYRDNLWHWQHFKDPQKFSRGSLMPQYTNFFDDKIDYSVIQQRVDAMAMLGVPYSKAALDDAPGLARAQAKQIADDLAARGGPTDATDLEVIAVIAYLQRLGTDIIPVPVPPKPEAK